MNENEVLKAFALNMLISYRERLHLCSVTSQMCFAFLHVPNLIFGTSTAA